MVEDRLRAPYAHLRVEAPGGNPRAVGVDMAREYRNALFVPAHGGVYGGEGYASVRLRTGGQDMCVPLCITHEGLVNFIVSEVSVQDADQILRSLVYRQY